MRAPRLDRPALLRGIRGALVIPAVFGLADSRYGPHTATFAVFGAFALLYLAEFTGPWRARTLAYLTLGAVGAGLIVIGTLCAARVGTAVAGMVVVGFAVLFAGAVNGYFAAGTTATLLAFVLAVMVPVPGAPVGDRLLGWLIACVVSIPAVLLLWPPHPGDALRAAAARACRALAAELTAVAAGTDAAAARSETAAAISALARRAVATPYRSTGPTGRDLALVSLLDEIRWLHPFVERLSAGPPRWGPEREAAYREVAAAGAAALEATADQLTGGAGRPDLDRLRAARDTLMGTVARHAPELLRADGSAVPELDIAFRLRVVTYLVRSVAEHAATATGGRAPDETVTGLPPPVRVAASALRDTAAALRTTGSIAADLASPRTVWFRNAVRGAIGLGLAVGVAQVVELQHAFWVVLGTLSVLRSSAVGTGTTALRALAGTLVGLVVGSALMLAVGSDEALLWVVLPVVVLLAGYGPAVSFAAGQAAFTVTVVVLFNLIQPAGWRVGLIRIEDVAVGVGVSVLVGVLFWPRGAARVLWGSLAVAYEAGADLVRAAGRRLLDEPGAAAAAEQAERASLTAARRVDDALRQYVAEGGGHPVEVTTVSRAASAVSRLRLTARSLDRVRLVADGQVRPAGCAELLAGDLAEVHGWYQEASAALAGRGPVPPPDRAGPERSARLRACVVGVSTTGDDATVLSGLLLVWASEYVEELRRLQDRLAGPAAEIARQATAPWWR